MSLAAIIPHMTSNNTPAPFIASTSNQLATYAPFNAFQDNTGAWISDVANSYIQIDLGRPYKVSKVFIDTVSSWTGAKMKSLSLQASIDGTDWKDLYVGPTTNYKYSEEREFGIYQHWRVRAGSMTSRGACVRYFQLYGIPAGLVVLEPNSIWVNAAPVTFKGTVYATHSAMDVRVLINDEVADDWHPFNGITEVEYEYEPSLFKYGGNVVTVENRDDSGIITKEYYVLYKLDLNIYKSNLSSYDFKIKNSPARPSTDGWIAQQFAMDYLNSERGISYVFRFKPYSQVDSRIEDRPRLFDRILHENYNIETDQLLGVRKSGIAIKNEGHQANIRKLLDTIKSDQFKSALKEIGLIQRVFDSWATMNTEDIGVKPDIKNLAVKKLKVSQDVLKNHNLSARRKEMIQNAFTMIQGYELSSRKVFDTVVQYYRAMEEFYPYKETIIGGLLINSVGEDTVGLKYPVLLSGAKEAETTVVASLNPLGYESENLTWKKDDQYAELLTPLPESVINEYLLANPKPKTNVHVADELRYGNKEEMYGTNTSHTFAITEDGQGSLYDVLLSLKEQSKDTHLTDVKWAYKDEIAKDVFVVETFLIDKGQNTKEFRIDDVHFVDTFNMDAYIETVREFVNLSPVEATEKTMLTFLDKMDVESHSIPLLTNINKMDTEVRLTGLNDLFDKTDEDAQDFKATISYVNKLDKSSIGEIPETLFNKQDADARDIKDDIYKVDKQNKDIRFDTSVMFIHKTDNKEAWPVFIDTLVEKMGRDMLTLVSDIFVDDATKTSYDYNNDLKYIDKLSHVMFNDEMLRTVEKLEKQAFVIALLSNVNSLEKASVIYDNWEFAIKKIESAKVIDDMARFGDKEEKFSDLYEQDLAYIENKKGFIIEQLLLDHENLNGYVMDLMDTANRTFSPKPPVIPPKPETPPKENDLREGQVFEEILADRNLALGFIQESIDANRKNQEKEAYVPENTFLLAGDGSEWEEIWDRYTPGVDILDPPDADYDYSKLAPAIYDPKTGVPKSPIGPSNKADVYVKASTSHPIPENSTVGVDDTKRIAVDNYIFIDFVLALESIKNRQKLRYAGMPVNKAIKEVFSQLYTWIQQAAPGHKEYERMFRFSRWYAEAIVLRSSKQILHRVYNPWQSSLHTGSGLGIDHTKPGWTYMTGTGTLDTTSLSAHLIFEKENYIDSEFVLRGYFDNPAGQGTMEISVDGVVVDSIVTHGIYERRIEIPQGHHSYDIYFYGTSGTASISSIEIGGTNFVSAHTTSDDSDVNGLKALTELIAQLLGYFELHHGGRKVKGTMEVRQRAVWNTHT